ncbi:MAG TPA: aldehyde oxidase, partial [Firmicutes bacterium]|nr:aldehyde oxidase [Bacillota bacterium]
MRVVSKPIRKIDGEAIVRGAPHYTMDMVPPDALYAKILRSPHAHARIKHIDKSEALKVPGVYLVLTHEDVPRVPFTTAGQNFPEPSPYDTFMLDSKVRFVGDRVAVVVAKDEVTASRACDLIRVEYEILPAVFDAREALKPGSPIIHDEPD